MKKKKKNLNKPRNAERIKEFHIKHRALFQKKRFFESFSG